MYSSYLVSAPMLSILEVAILSFILMVPHVRVPERVGTLLRRPVRCRLEYEQLHTRLALKTCATVQRDHHSSIAHVS